MNHLEEEDGIPGFVGLQMADHMPAEVPGAVWDFDFGSERGSPQKPLACCGEGADGFAG